MSGTPCWNKVRYTTKWRAQDKAQDAREREGTDLIHAYYCKPCGAWHIGHSWGPPVKNLERAMKRMDANDRNNHLPLD